MTQFKLLYYKDLDSSGLEQKFTKVCAHLAQGDFQNADVKKISLKGYYRAKLDDTNRLLFKPIKYNNTTHLLLLEIIRNHNYNKSRFLRGAAIKESNITSIVDVTSHPEDTLSFLGNNEAKVHYLNNFIVFDEIQNNIFDYDLPLILIGSAGSGKTSLVLEKMKTIVGEILYVTLSPYLVQNARQLYYANYYQNSNQSIDFLSFKELIETIAIPPGNEITSAVFLTWHQRQKKSSVLHDGQKLYEEFRGVIAGSETKSPYLSQENYLKLGVRKSIYAESERAEVYRLFQNYLNFLEKEQYFDTNILSYTYKAQASLHYDAVIIDEVQDFTNSQLSLILAMIKEPQQFLMCGDANQIVHPNFFSWSGLKQLCYTSEELAPHEITRILTRNYRNTPEVIELANRILKIKNARFGSIDKASHYLIESQSDNKGDVACIKATPEKIADLNKKISRSITFAIITFNEQQKEEARKLFDTPLVFTVQEAKGLEYENVILYHFITSEPRFSDIATGLTPAVLEQEFTYGRAKSKADKSIEVYKFYINSLYVGITRAKENVYLIEKNPAHPLLNLLDINEINQSLIKDIQESSLEEWQKEASRLASQGKDEQAEAITQIILKQKTPSWTVIDKKLYSQLWTKIFISKKYTKKDQFDLFEVAMLYDDITSIQKLHQQGFRPAGNPKKSYPIMYDKHFKKYSIKNSQAVHKDIQMYGIEHRTEMNHTPLLAAIYAGNLNLIHEIMALMPSLEATDSLLRTPLQLAIYRTIFGEIKTNTLLANIYQLICSDSISLDVDGHLVKIDASKAEYLLFNLVLTAYAKITLHHLHADQLSVIKGFKAQQLFGLVQNLPDTIWPEYRKKKHYLSSLLSRNEIAISYKPNRKLFQRVARGYYILNPQLKIKTASEWQLIKPPGLEFMFSEPIKN